MNDTDGTLAHELHDRAPHTLEASKEASSGWHQRYDHAVYCHCTGGWIAVRSISFAGLTVSLTRQTDLLRVDLLDPYLCNGPTANLLHSSERIAQPCSLACFVVKH